MAALSPSETFESMEDLRQRLRFYSSSANHCPFYLKSSKPERIDARCPSTKSSDDSDVQCGFNLTGYKHKDGLISPQKSDTTTFSFLHYATVLICFCLKRNSLAIIKKI
ncbi:hypothetical protein BASA83_002418 [Batrachochytrium salamandrivorans]|nr:hypothetical protein BASA83_002418 [Batrachochytrium salamandrivorans]